MKTKRMLLMLLFAACGCSGEPQDTVMFAPEEPATAQLEEDGKSSWREQELIVIGQVICTQSDRVSQTLKQAGIECIVQGDEFHDISVPRDRREEAVRVVRKDAREAGYEITLSTH